MKYSPKKTFSIAGLALFAAVAGSAVFSMLILTPLFMANDGAFMKKLVECGYASLMVLFTYVPQILALLIFWLIIRLIPKGESGSSQFSFGWLFQVFLMGYGVSTVLNVIGTVLNKSTGGTDFVGEISSMISTGLVVTFLIPVVIGLIREELIFRKLLIDRIRRFGEWNAVLFSALAFGLFHMNLPQFCYLGRPDARLCLRQDRQDPLYDHHAHPAQQRLLTDRTRHDGRFGEGIDHTAQCCGNPDYCRRHIRHHPVLCEKEEAAVRFRHAGRHPA